MLTRIIFSVEAQWTLKKTQNLVSNSGVLLR